MTQRACLVEMIGSCNFRDLGGYSAAGGIRIKKGRLFRSDHLSDLVPDDMEKLETFRIATVIDFRDNQEAGMAPDLLPSTVRTIFPLSIDAGSLMGASGRGNLTVAKTTGMMISVYRALVSDFQAIYREFFRIVSKPDAAPLLFHCSAGKDRTGVAAALLLSALGVARATVMEDYLFSKSCMKKKYRLGIDYNEVMEPLFSVRPEYLQAAFEVIDDRYGGMDAYLKNQLDVDCGVLRETYTEAGLQ